MILSIEYLLDGLMGFEDFFIYFCCERGIVSYSYV